MDPLVTSDLKATSNFSLGLVTFLAIIVSLQQVTTGCFGTKLAKKADYGSYLSDMASSKYNLSGPLGVISSRFWIESRRVRLHWSSFGESMTLLGVSAIT